MNWTFNRNRLPASVYSAVRGSARTFRPALVALAGCEGGEARNKTSRFLGCFFCSGPTSSAENSVRDGRWVGLGPVCWLYAQPTETSFYDYVRWCAWLWFAAVGWTIQEMIMQPNDCWRLDLHLQTRSISNRGIAHVLHDRFRRCSVFYRSECALIAFAYRLLLVPRE